MMSDPVRHGLQRKLLAVLVAACYGTAYGNPSGPQVAAGQASFLQQGNLYTITNTPNTIINWQNFSVNPNEITRFIQQSGDSKVLNRIVGQDPSKILGSLQSNGKVYLINPNGVLFGKDARVDVNGLVASSLAISNSDFLAGKHHFSGDSKASVVNQGSITTPGGGRVYLIASSVENSGVITSPQGEVVLAAGNSVQLVDSANPDVHVVVSAPGDQALNLGQVLASGGKVGIYGALVNQRGRVSADSAAVGANGKIVLKASGTTMLEAGSRTTAVNAAGKGGDIQLLGDRVGLTGDAAVDASGAAGGGAVLIGGDYQGKNAAVPHAQQTYIGEQVTVRADATRHGDGGKVVAWSDGATRVYGSLSARGGELGGNGGMLETSGHYLDMQGKADTRAPQGKTGSLLLDPTNIYIVADSSSVMYGGAMPAPGQSGSNPSIFLPTGTVADSLLLTSTLTGALASSDVTVTTANTAGGGNGTITVGSEVAWSAATSLTLHADKDIILNAAVKNAAGGLKLEAGGAIAQTTSPVDALQVASLGAIAAGNITLLNAGNTVTGTTTAATTGGNVALSGTALNLGASSASGTFTAEAASGALTVSGVLSSGGNMALAASQANAGITLETGASLASSGGNIALKADNMALHGTIEGGAHMVSLLANSAGTDMKLGADAQDAAGTLGLSDLELQKIHLATNGLLVVGRGPDGGSVTVSGDLDLGGSLGNGGLMLSASTGHLTINDNVKLTAPGIVNLQSGPSGTSTFTNKGTVQAGSGINVFAGDVVLAGGHLNGSWVSIESLNSIDVGAETTSGKMAINAADLAGISTASLSLSTNSSAPYSGIAISQPLAVTGNLTLRGQKGSEDGASSGIGINSALTVTGDLTLYSDGKVSATGAVSTGGVFSLNTGNWEQVISNLPAFSANDFRLASGTSFLRATAGTGDSSFVLVDVYGLQGAATMASLPFTLGATIEAGGTANWNASGGGSAGFRPIGTSGSPYSGTFRGEGFAINGLTINRTGEDYVGLFGSVSGTVQDVTLAGGSVNGRFDVGAVAGTVASGTINNVRSSAAVSGIGRAGGLAGSNAGSITASSASGAVTGGYADMYASSIGGLAGISTGTISGSSASGAVETSGQGYAGGLVGTNGGSVDTSFATGAVGSSGEIVGGLVGDNYGSISRAYATGNVAGGRNVGGLVGRNGSNFNQTGSIVNAYAGGNVSGRAGSTEFTHANAGGLLGEFFAGSVANVFSNGSVNGDTFAAGTANGLVGATNSYISGFSLGEGGSNQVTHGYFDATKAGRTTDAAGGTALTTAQTMQQASFAFDFVEAPAWRIYEGYTTPLLKAFLKPVIVTVTGNNATAVYGDTLPAFVATNTPGYAGLASGDSLSGTLGWGNAKNAGTYGPGGLYSTLYDISYASGAPSLEITKRALTAVVGGSKVYDGTTTFSNPSVSLSGMAYGDTASATASAAFTSPGAGIGKALTGVSVTLSEGTSRNYTVTNPASATADITRAPLNVSGIAGVSRVYDGTTAAGITGSLSVTAIGSDAVGASLGGGYTFANKNVGEGKPINVPLTLTGDAKDNYLPYTTVTANITSAPITITGLSGVDRVYDGTSGASVTNAVFSGVLSGDNVSLGMTHAYFTNGKNVGTAKPIGFEGLPSLSGTDGGNYHVAAVPTGLTANVTPATLTVSGLSAVSRTYNGGTSAALLTEGAQVSGRLYQDDVYLSASGASGVFADANVGTGKTVTVSNLGLAGDDAGNYTFTTPALSADITQLGKAVWTGNAQNKLWSDSGNWQNGAVPTASNVLNAELGDYGGEVIFDGGSTTLNALLSIHGQDLKQTGGTLAVHTLNANMDLTVAGGAMTLGVPEGGTLSLNGGTLTVGSGTLNLIGALSAGSHVQSGGALSGSSGSSLTASQFNMSGGAITGLQALTINSQYAHSGGSIVMPGTATIHSYGNLAVGPMTATAGISLYATEGAAISQTGALDTAYLQVSGQGGITLNNSNNHVLKFSGTTGSGSITLFNKLSGTDQLNLAGVNSAGGSIVVDNVGGIYTTGNLAASNGAISLTAHSPITLSNLVQADNIVLSASTDIALMGGAMVVADNNIAMQAGTGIQLNGNAAVNAANSVAMAAGGGIQMSNAASIQATQDIAMTAGSNIELAGLLQSTSGGISVLTQGGSITADAAMTINGSGAITLSSATGSVSAPPGIFQGSGVPVVSDGAAAAAAAEAAAKAAADAAAKAAADAAAKAAADAAAKAAADAAAKAAADAAAKAAADAAAKAAAEAAAKAAADAAAKAEADAKAAADAAAKAAADAAAKAAADAAAKAAADAAAKAAADAAAKEAADAAAKAAADAAAKAAADAAAKAAADAAADAAAEAAAKAAAEAAAKAAAEAAEAAAKAAADAAAKAAADAAAEAAAKAAADAAAKAAADAAAKAAAEEAAAKAAAAKAAADAAAKAAAEAAAKAAADKAAADAAAKAAADAAAKAAADKAAADASQNQPNQPVGQAINSTVNIINTASSATKTEPAPVTSGTSAGGGSKEEAAPEAKKEEKKDGIASKDSVVQKDDIQKKTYCN